MASLTPTIPAVLDARGVDLPPQHGCPLCTELLLDPCHRPEDVYEAIDALTRAYPSALGELTAHLLTELGSEDVSPVLKARSDSQRLRDALSGWLGFPALALVAAADHLRECPEYRGRGR